MEANDFTRGMGANLRRMRIARGWTVEETAGKAGLSADSITKYENGQRMMSGEKILLAARVLDCSILEIYRGLNPDRKEDILSGKTMNVLSPAASMVAYWLATEWDGDQDALMILMGVVASFPVDVRREFYMDVMLTKDRLIKSGAITIDDLPPYYAEAERRLGGLYAL